MSTTSMISSLVYNAKERAERVLTDTTKILRRISGQVYDLTWTTRDILTLAFDYKTYEDPVCIETLQSRVLSYNELKYRLRTGN